VAQPRQVDIYDYTGQAHFVKPLPKFQAHVWLLRTESIQICWCVQTFLLPGCPPEYLLHSMRHRAEWSIMERTSYQNISYPLHQKQGISYIARCWETAFYILIFYVF